MVTRFTIIRKQPLRFKKKKKKKKKDEEIIKYKYIESNERHILVRKTPNFI